MARMRTVERAEGRGTLSAESLSASLSVSYTINVRQKVHRTDTFGGSSEDLGGYQMDGFISASESHTAELLGIMAGDGHAELTLKDGRKASVVLMGEGFTLPGGGPIRCQVNTLEGYA